ncbi:MAG TPA: site-specific integrase [Actinobacteria bacterium]|nr:site-specific integrase [Actinomycetota bacterium]
MTAAAPAVILLEDLRRLGPLGRFEALLASPDVPGWLLAEPVVFAREDPLFGYACGIEGCEGHSTQAGLWCPRHAKQRWAALKAGVTESAWGSAAVPFAASPGWGGDSPLPACRFCPDRDAVSEGICVRHKVSRDYARKRDGAGFDEASWAARQHSLPGAGACLAGGCQGRAELSPALCRRHRAAWQRAGSPQGGEFTGWLSRAEGWGGRGVLVLERLPPLAAAEIRYGLFAHTLEPAPARWHPMWLRTLVRSCLERGAVSLLELDPGEGGWTRQPASVNRILRDLLRHARSVHRTREETREDGCLDPGYWGVRFPNRRSAFDLTAIPQRWLRDLGWDYLASVLEGPGRPRTAGPFEQARRSLVCLGAYLHDRAPLQGERPGMLTAETARGFTADFRQRVTAARPVRGVFNVDGSPSLAAESTYSVTMNAVRKVMRWSLEHDRPDGPPREFIVAFPAGQAKARRNPRPFSDPVLQVLGDPANLALLAGRDPNDNGVADIWRVQLRCGRRIGEVVNLRFDCVSEHLGRTWLWVDMTKVGKLDYAIQIPRDVYDLIRARQDKTTARFRAKFGRSPSAGERRAIALFPSRVANPAFERAVSIATFTTAFKDWLGCEEVDLPGHTSHQARHTLATRLVAAGASMAHVKKVLGHVSEAMSEAYVLIAGDQVEPYLRQVWVKGPGAADPGDVVLLPTEEDKAAAAALLLDLAVIPIEHGLCTFKPVAGGADCPFSKQCHTCEHFVLTGADYSYWKRQEQRQAVLAEGAPSPEARDYLYQAFEPNSQAIAGLEKALAAAGLLDEARQLDLRTPHQDFYDPIWRTGWRASDLAELAAGHPGGQAQPAPGADDSGGREQPWE